MLNVTTPVRALVSLGGAVIGGWLCTLNGFSEAATLGLSLLFFILLWTWLRR